MLSKKMREALEAFAGAQPWNHLNENGVFCVETSGRGMVYAVGLGEEQGAGVMVFESPRAVAAFGYLIDANNQEDRLFRQCMELEQECLECRLNVHGDTEAEAWMAAFGETAAERACERPMLRRREYARIPEHLNREDEELLAVVLHAAVQLAAGKNNDLMARMTGSGSIPCAVVQPDGSFIWHRVDAEAGAGIEYPYLTMGDELAMRRLARKPSSGAAFSCAVRVLPIDIEDADGYPVGMMMMDSMRGVIGVPVVQNYATDYPKLASEFLSYVEEFGRPTHIRVCDPRTATLLQGVAKQLGLTIEMNRVIPEINEAFADFYNYMMGPAETESDEEDENNEPFEVRPPEGGGRGICLLCEKEFTTAGMARHIKSCAAGRREPGDTPYYLIRVTAADDPNYWLFLEAKKDTSLKQLDQLLQDTWMQGEGGIRLFKIGDSVCSSSRTIGSSNLTPRLEEVVGKGDKFDYVFDLEAPTVLTLQVADEYNAKNRRKKIEVLARNIMPKYFCVRCGKPAQMVFRLDEEDMIEECTFCSQCAQQEEDAEYMEELFNSPRTGIGNLIEMMPDDEDDE